MMSLVSFTALATLLATGLAAPQRLGNRGYDLNATGSTQCYTSMATTRGPYNTATTWSTFYTPCVVTSTITVNTTLTPTASVTTSTTTTTTTTTAPTTSFTSTETATSTSTTTLTTTSVITTTTTTTTTSTSRSIVPAPATFMPIQSSLPGASYDGAGGPDPVVRRDLAPRRPSNDCGCRPCSQAAHSGDSPPKPDLLSKPGFSPQQYPQGVKCYKWQNQTCSTVSVTTTNTVIAATPTSTTTITSTSTSTVVPSATTTTTLTTSTITTTTTTTTSTSTITTTTTTTTSTTVYAACATNNFADSYQGQGIGGYQGASNAGEVVVASSAYDCCVAALTNPTPVAIWLFQNGNTFCFLGTQIDRSCPNPAGNYAQAIQQATPLYTIGNGYCGVVNGAV